METLTDQLIAEVAKENGIEPAAFLAVKYVEAGKFSGFYSDGRPIVLFEGQVFYRQLRLTHSDEAMKKLIEQYPTLIYPKWTKKFYQKGDKECDRLEAAAKINREAALKSASWGLFQIMGFNWKVAGCSSLQDFVNKNYKGHREQLQLAVNFLKSSNLLSKLAKHDWEGFAKGYNGVGYKENKYDSKLKEYYEKFSKVY